MPAPRTGGGARARLPRDPPLGERPASGRAAMLGLARTIRSCALVRRLAARPGAAVGGGEQPRRCRPSCRPGSRAAFDPLVGRSEWPALLERAPLDLRVNRLQGQPRASCRGAFPGEPTPLSPGACGCPEGSRSTITGLGARAGRGAGRGQPAARARLRRGRGAHRRPVRRRGRQDAGARRRDGPGADPRLRHRPRAPVQAAAAAGAGGRTIVEPRLLDPAARAEALADLRGPADLVLVDAPCSGSGTWRRNPEGRWRLTPERLDRLVALQARLLDSPRAGPARRRAGLCRLLAASREGRRAGRRLPRRRSGLGCRGNAYRLRAGRGRPAADPGARRHRRLFRRAVAGAMLGARRIWSFDAPLPDCPDLGRFAPSRPGERRPRPAPDDQIDARSSARAAAQGEALLAAGKFHEATMRSRPRWPSIRATAPPMSSGPRRAEAEAVRQGDPLLPTRRCARAERPTRLPSRARRWCSAAPSRAPSAISRSSELCAAALPAGDHACRRDRSAAPAVGARAKPRSRTARRRTKRQRARARRTRRR
jgi:16S rRNA (cytosine967-C5)-methyltransferase